MLSRRDMIRFGATTVGTLALRPFGLLPALAQSSADYRALVCVFLFGGNDSNNMIIPMDDTRYKQYTSIRGSLALTGADLTGKVYAKTGGAPYAFHSDLTEVASLFSNGELAVAANVGTLVKPINRSQYQSQSVTVPRNLFSHLDQQTEWQTSNLTTSSSPTGWAGRAADLVAAQNTSKFPTFMSVAGNVVMGNGAHTEQVDLNPGGSLDLPGFNTTATSVTRKKALENLLTFDSGLKMAQAANGILSNSLDDANSLTTALAKASIKTVFPKTGLGAQLQQVAQIVQVRESLGMRRQVFFCALGGFDTHQMEIATHKALYPQLSQALLAFNSAMQEIGTENDVTTFTESDFSRTFQPTAIDGSDHAWGSHHLIMGGAVKGGDIYGSLPQFILGGPDDADTRGRWIPSTAMDQYGATLCSWLGVSGTDLNTVFPNFANFNNQKLSFLG